DENITPESEVADETVADLAAEVAEDYSEADYTLGDVEYAGEVDTQVDPAVVSGPAQAVGRRKEAVARVRLVPGAGQFTLNGRARAGRRPSQGSRGAGPAGAALRTVHAGRPAPGGVLPQQGPPAARQGAAGGRRARGAVRHRRAAARWRRRGTGRRAASGHRP